MKRKDQLRLARIRASLHASPWAMNVRAFGVLHEAVASGDLEMVKATLSLGSERAESIAKMVNGIAVIPVTGVLQEADDYMVRWGYASSYQQIEAAFKEAITNSDVKGVMFYANSPGGSAIGCKRIGDLIFESRGAKPIRTYVQGMCCSAMYYIGSASDQIDATEDSLCGSIGTIYPHMEISGMLENIGYKAKVFTNSDSPKKGHGNMYEPLDDAARKTLQGYVDSYGKPFISDVARYRGIDAATVVENFGQGDALRADVALKHGMIDRVVKSFQESLDSISAAARSVSGANTSTVRRRGQHQTE